MMIFLDTDIMSYFSAGNSVIGAKTKEALNYGHQICLTCVNVYEILKGLRYNPNKNKELFLTEFLKKVPVIYIEEADIQKAAEIYADLRKNGIIIGDADIFIASIVMTNGGKLITNNIRHYQNIKGLIVENWRQ